MCNLVLFVHHKYVSPQIAKMQDKDFEAKDVGWLGIEIQPENDDVNQTHKHIKIG